MEVAVQGNCLESGFVIGAVCDHYARAMVRAESEKADRRLHATPTARTQKRLA
jgi:hypothetical protein